MIKYGVLGESLPHSFSPQIHKMLGNDDYGIIEVKKNKFDEFMQKREFKAINVTIPYKTAVLPYLSEISETAKKIGCVNTIIKSDDGSLKGYNTDYNGVEYMLRRAGIDVSERKCMILGAGGTSLTVSAVLKDLGADEIIVVSRSVKKSEKSGEKAQNRSIVTKVINYDELEDYKDVQLIVNTTPVGMYPNNGDLPVYLKDFTCLEAVVDVIYNPFKTALIQEAEKLGLKTTGGLSMFAAQAKYASDIFFDRHTDDNIIEDIYKRLKADMENIVLIGMPGCGKTTVGRMLSERLCKKFSDTDRIVEDLEGKSIQDIFATYGEKYFRNTETEACKIAGAKRSHVIAAGGGAIIRDENIDSLSQNAVMVYIKRDIDKLSVGGRPLSKNIETLHSIFDERRAKYESAADFTVDNNGNAEECVNKIVKYFENI